MKNIKKYLMLIPMVVSFGSCNAMNRDGNIYDLHEHTEINTNLLECLKECNPFEQWKKYWASSSTNKLIREVKKYPIAYYHDMYLDTPFVKVIEKLCTMYADINYVDDYGNTPLMMLLNNSRIDDKVTPDTLDKIILLLANETNVNFLNQNQENALIIALKNPNLSSNYLYSIVDLLIKNKINIDQKDSEGNTALILAAKKGNEVLRPIEKNDMYEVVNILLRHEAATDIANDNNETAYDVAIDQKVKDLIYDNPNMIARFAK